MARDWIAEATEYAIGVNEGTILAPKWVRLACKRQVEDLERSVSDDYPYVFDLEAAAKPCRFAENMIHVKGEWAKPTPDGGLPEIHLEPWQCFILTTLFGWKRKSNSKLRRFREIYAEIPRKNAKSTLGAIIGLFMLVGDDEIGAEVFCGATSLEQALYVFKPAWLMVKRNPEFAARYELSVGGTERNPGPIYCTKTGNSFAAVIGKPGDGASPSCAIVDEYHEHTSPEQYDAFKTGQGARSNPLRVVITTAGSDTSGPCYDKHLEAVKVLDGSLENDELFTLIYALDEGADWKDFENWKVANPNFNVSVFEHYLRGQHRDALQQPSQQNIILTKNLNKWMNAGVAWMNMAKWDAQCDTALTFEALHGADCWLAFDLANKIDICSLAYIVRMPDGGFAFFCKHYLPSDTVNLPPNDHYRKWQVEGWLHVNDGARTDYQQIHEDIREASEKFNVKSLSYDQREANYLVQAIEEWASFPIIEIPQTPLHMSEPMKEMEAMVYAGTLWHAGDPVLTWMMGNVVQKEGRGGPVKSYYPTKEKPQNKIDGVVAGIMAIKQAMIADEEFIYNTRGPLVLG